MALFFVDMGGNIPVLSQGTEIPQTTKHGQKEKIQKNLFRLMEMGRGEERVRYMESHMKLTLPYAK